MSSQKGGALDDDSLWLEIISEKEPETQQVVPSQIDVVYTRRKPQQLDEEESSGVPEILCPIPTRAQHVAFPKPKRTGWNHNLSIRGRTSIWLPGAEDNIPHPKQEAKKKKKKKQAPCQKKSANLNLPDFAEERAYFQELDASELLLESPSPKRAQEKMVIHDLSAILKRWGISKTISQNFGHLVAELTRCSLPQRLNNLNEALECASQSSVAGKIDAYQKSVTSKPRNDFSIGNLAEDRVSDSLDALRIKEESDDNMHPSLEEVVKNGALVQSSPLSAEFQSPFTQLLMACNQTEPLTLSGMFSQYCDLSNVHKIGEGTYGEIFKAGNNIFKIVPIDGDSLVNGEKQKRSDEVIGEVILSLTLNSLRGRDGHVPDQNACTNFVDAKDFWVCQGTYGDSLVSIWEEWDSKTLNDNPKEFSERQCYIVFILADGGVDLESFMLSDFNEARSLLTQVTAALAVAEAAFQFEHRDLHWGNIVIARKETPTLNFTVRGQKSVAKTFGIVISIIDFTLSRINTGEAILSFDLSSDPEIFEGPKGDVQFETYRKMKEVTEDRWKGSFPKTNVLWLQYLIDILLKKKSIKPKDGRSLRALKKRMGSYDSAEDCLSDTFFHDILIYQTT